MTLVPTLRFTSVIQSPQLWGGADGVAGLANEAAISA
jgi:hypothetical protein